MPVTNKKTKVLLKALLVFIAAFGMGMAIAMYYAAGLGSDPYSMFVEALAMLVGVSTGTMSLLCNVALILWGLFFARKLIGLGTFIQAVSVGAGIDVGALLWARVGVNAMAVRVVFACMGAVLCGVSIAMYLACETGASPIDLLILKAGEKLKLRYQFAFWAVYAVLFLAGVVLGGIWGVGTLIALVTTGFVADALQPRFKRLFAGLQ